MSDNSSVEEKPIEVLFKAVEESSGEEVPMSEWSSLIAISNALKQIDTSKDDKRALFARGEYSPGSPDICNKYIGMSDSAIFRHPYYNYPAVLDPGIREALMEPDKDVVYPDDGQDLYLQLCSEMNICPVGLFHRSLLKPEINVSYYGVDPRGIRAMALALKYNKHVKRFDLTDNFLSDDACFHLGRMLASNITLEELVLAGCRVGPTGVYRLGDKLCDNRTLQSLNLARNNIGDEGAERFSKQLQDTTIKRLNLSSNQLGREAAVALATEVFEWRHSITHIDLSKNNFVHIPSAVKMLDLIATSTDIVDINLSFNSFQGDRIATSIKELLLIPTLQVLNLSYNRFQNEAITLIISNLIQARKLITLDLSFNPLSPEDANNVLKTMLKPKVKVNNILMENVCVDKAFIELVKRVKNMKSRKDFHVTFGTILGNWDVRGPDARELILRRANFLGNASKKHKTDITLYFYALNKELTRPIPVKNLIEKLEQNNVPLDEGLVTELSYVFAGPKTPKSRTVDVSLICDYLHRIWPEKELPPTPPPEPEPEPQQEPQPKPKAKGKKGKK